MNVLAICCWIHSPSMSHIVEIATHIKNINLNFFQPIKSRFYSLRKSTQFILFRKQKVYFRLSLDLQQTYHPLNFFEQIIQHYWRVNKNLSCLLLIVNFSIIISYILSTVTKIFSTYYLYAALEDPCKKVGYILFVKYYMKRN